VSRSRPYGSSTVNRHSRAELDAVDDAIIAAVDADSPVTLRGVFYRAVSAGAVEKTELGYRLIGRQLLKLRRSGAVSYADITDGTRWITKPRTWDSLDQFLDDAAVSYRRALWHDQPIEVQVFTEKDAISGVIEPVTGRYDVPLGVLRGYASESFAWTVAQSVMQGAGEVFIYQLGDHDPSGVDAWRAFTAKVTGFVDEHYTDTADWLHFERLAVTPEQITAMGLPTRPTKQADSRAARFAGESVEVDAIPAPELRRILIAAIEQHIDQHALHAAQAAEASERDILTAMRDGTY
jgi:hypothetical protein